MSLGEQQSENYEEELKLNTKFDKVIENIDEIEKLVEILEQEKNFNKLSESVSLQDYAQLNANTAFALNSVYFSFLKANGVNIKDHRVNNEITRVKEYMVKIKKATEPKAMEGQKRNFSINTEATGRIIKATANANKVIEKQQQQEKMEIEESRKQNNNQEQEDIKDAWENDDADEMIKENKKKVMSRGAILPSKQHLNWKDQINKIMQ